MKKAAADKDNLPLDSALDFLQRLWRLNRALEKLSSHMEDRFGITAQQRLVIRCVSKFPGMTAGQLASVLHVDPGTVSAALKRLAHKELLERRNDPRDKRRVTLGLTTSGRALAKPSRHTVEHAVERMLESSSRAELDAAKNMLDRLTRLIDAEHSGPQD